MTDEERIEAANKRYGAAMHAVQAGVAMRMELDANDGIAARSFTSPKHLRVGVESAMVTDKGLAQLLIAKGIINEVEYHEAMAKAAEEERADWEAELSKALGAMVTLK